jgi:hypothetical protein
VAAQEKERLEGDGIERKKRKLGDRQEGGKVEKLSKNEEKVEQKKTLWKGFGDGFDRQSGRLYDSKQWAVL